MHTAATSPRLATTDQNPSRRTSPASAGLLPRRRPPRQHRSVLVLLLVTLTASACGSARAEQVALVDPATVAADDPATVEATLAAVPTTAPVLPPPDDLELPALAPVEQIQQALDAAAAARATDEPVGSLESIDDGAIASTQAPEAAEPAQATSAAHRTDQVITLTTTADRWDSCVVSAAQAHGATALLDAIVLEPALDLTSVQLNHLAAAAHACESLVCRLSATDLADHLSVADSCLGQWLASDAGGSVFVGLTAIGDLRAVPLWAATETAAAIDSCFGGASFAALVMADVAADSRLVAAFDADCLAPSFDQAGVMARYAGDLVADPATATLAIGLSDPWVLACVDVGRLVAVAAAADGVMLAATTVSCIDTELKSAGLVGELVAGTADGETVGLVTIGCLSQDEASALLG